MTEPEILFDRRGRIGLITLNRPQALNALSLGMIDAMTAQLRRWADDDGVAAVVVRGAGGRAFCAGGDVAGLAREGLAERRGETVATTARRDFFRREYVLDQLTATYPKPYICLIDGIVMGGGVGISIHGPHRVVSERALFAMPETAIGLFPDVGATHVLPRLPGRLGRYLGLTGARLGAADLVYAGIATAFVPSDGFEGLIAALADSAADCAAVIARHAAPPPQPSSLAAARDAIDRCFAADDMAGIFAALAAEDSDWARETTAGLGRMSPTSLVLTLEALRRGAGLGLDDCLIMEYRLSQGCMAGHDFYEGVRAVLLDKDKAPKWSPARLADVNGRLIDGHFATPPAGDLRFADIKSPD